MTHGINGRGANLNYVDLEDLTLMSYNEKTLFEQLGALTGLSVGSIQKLGLEEIHHAPVFEELKSIIPSKVHAFFRYIDRLNIYTWQEFLQELNSLPRTSLSDFINIMSSLDDVADRVELIEVIKDLNIICNHINLSLEEFIDKCGSTFLISLYPKAIRCCSKLDWPLEKFIAFFRKPNSQKLSLIELLPEQFEILCKARGEIEILDILNSNTDLNKFIYLISKAKEIESMCAKMEVKFEDLYSLSYETLIEKNYYTTENLKPFLEHNLYEKQNIPMKELICKIMFHIACSTISNNDVFLKEIKASDKKNLEGISHETFINFITPLLLDIINRPNTVFKQEEINKINSVFKSIKFTNKNINIKGYKEIKAAHLVNEIRAQKNSDNFNLLIPGGWFGHAVMYGIHKEENKQTYCFSLWNTGDGIKHHHQSNSGKYQVRATWSGLSLEQIADHAFLAKLLEKQYSTVPTYDVINDHFKQEQDLPSKNPADYHHPQKQNVCAWKCFWAAVADLLGRNIDPDTAWKVKLALIDEVERIFENTVSKEQQLAIDVILKVFTSRSKENLEKKILLHEISKETGELAEKKLCVIKFWEDFHVLLKFPGVSLEQLLSLEKPRLDWFLMNSADIRLQSRMLQASFNDWLKIPLEKAIFICEKLEKNLKGLKKISHPYGISLQVLANLEEEYLDLILQNAEKIRSLNIEQGDFETLISLPFPELKERLEKKLGLL